MNMNLRELYLADNKLNGLQDSAQLGNLLKFNYNIQILDLRNNHILDSGAVVVLNTILVYLNSNFVLQIFSRHKKVCSFCIDTNKCHIIMILIIFLWKCKNSLTVNRIVIAISVENNRICFNWPYHAPPITWKKFSVQNMDVFNVSP